MSLLSKYAKKIKDAKDSGGGNHMIPGLYLIKVAKSIELEEARRGNAVWYRTFWEIEAFKGCKHKKYHDNGPPTMTDSYGMLEPGQTVNTILDISNENFQGAVHKLWVHQLSSVEGFADMSLDEIEAEWGQEDVETMINEDLIVGHTFVCEVQNTGKFKDKHTGIPTADFYKPVMWCALSRYTGRKWWETEEATQGDLPL